MACRADDNVAACDPEALSVWVIDDTPSIGIVMTALVRSLGHDAVVFTDSTEALRQLGQLEDSQCLQFMFIDR